MPKPTLYNIFNSLVKAVKTTEVGNIYLTNAPSSGNKDVSQFVVIALPSRLDRDVKGNDDFIVSTSGVFHIAVKAKSDNTPNIKAQTELVQKFMELFPINDDYISATSPQILINGDNKAGYQVTSIFFDIRTKINQFLK
jgi:hypothetical protein